MPRFIPFVIAFLTFGTARADHDQGGYPVNCLNEGRPMCRTNADCVDASSVYGADANCGTVVCDVPSGTCTKIIWPTGRCRNRALRCDGNDNMCTQGPTGLSFKGRCNGWNQRLCTYYWCPKGDAVSSTTQPVRTTLPTATASTTQVDTTTSQPSTIATTTVAPTTTTTEAATTTTATTTPTTQAASTIVQSSTTTIGSGEICCTTDNDCINYPGSPALLTTCGTVRCNAVSSKCEYDVWNESDECRDKFFVWCGDSDGTSQEVKDTRCTKGPTGDSGTVEGKCTLFGATECRYTYCPGGGTTASPLTTTTVTSTTEADTTALATTTSPPTTTSKEVVTTTEVITTTSATTTTPSTTTTRNPTGMCCYTANDCKADVGKPQLLDCGNARCENNQCVFETRNDSKDYCNQAYLVQCSGNDNLCNVGPAGSVGSCDLSGGTLCSYRWCPGASAPGTTLPPVLPPVTGGDFWRPPQIQTWDWQLYNKVEYSRDVDVYDVDLFINSAEDISNIKTKGGTITDPAKYRKVICYFSAGSYENWRPDEAKFPEEVKGVLYYGFPNERWLDIRRMDILGPIMSDRLNMAKAKGCDAVEPDNMDVYDDTAHEASGFPLTFQDQLDYNIWLSEQAHLRGMACGLKNDVNQAAILEPYFEFVVSEQCVEYKECRFFQRFADVGKPIFLCEYNLATSQFCDEAAFYKAMAIKKNGNLETEYEACPPWWMRRGLRGDERISRY